MPIKSCSNYPAPKNYYYPKLMVSQNLTIVLFHSKGEGVVVESDKHEEVGCYSSDWVMPNFKDYHGDITLSNC